MTVQLYLSTTSQVLFVFLLCVMMVEIGIIATTYSWKVMQRILGRADKHLDKAEKLPAQWRKKRTEEQAQLKVVQKVNGKNGKKAVQ